jgi:hypothetical protein
MSNDKNYYYGAPDDFGTFNAEAMPLMSDDDGEMAWDAKLGNAMDRVLRRIFVCLGLLDP